MSNTKQRLDDLIALSDNKEIRLLAQIIKDSASDESNMGFSVSDEPDSNK